MMQARQFYRLDWVVTACCLVLLGYIAWHVLQGPRGYGYQEKLLQQSASLQSELVHLKNRNKAFEQKVQLLRPESIDPDMVDELARRDLGLVGENDIILILSTDSP